MSTLALLGDVLTQHGQVVLAVDGDQTAGDGVSLNLALWSSIAGTITPFLVALVNQPRWSATVKALLTVLVSLGVGAVTSALEGNLDGARLVTSTLVVLAAAVSTYHTLWKTTATQIEAATAFGSGQGHLTR